MMRRAFCFLAAVALLAPIAAISQEKKTSTQAVEKRLKAVEKEKVSPAIEEAIRALNAASGFDQAAVSPDGKKVAWLKKSATKMAWTPATQRFTSKDFIQRKQQPA